MTTRHFVGSCPRSCLNTVQAVSRFGPALQVFQLIFLRQHVGNVAVFVPCDIESAVGALPQLDLQQGERTDFVRAFARGRIMDAMAQDILLLNKPAC